MFDTISEADCTNMSLGARLSNAGPSRRRPVINHPNEDLAIALDAFQTTEEVRYAAMAARILELELGAPADLSKLAAKRPHT